MAVYKHGAYGELAKTVSQPTRQMSTIAVYVGTAPVNLVRGYDKSVNKPVLLNELTRARRQVGYSNDWNTFTLCEAIKAHFDNSFGNAGPIVVINVLNPETHKKSSPVTKSLTFINKRATIDGEHIILDTLVLADKVEGVDFTIEYDYDAKQTVLTDISADGISGSVNATYSEIDTASIKADAIIGDITAEGVYTGLGCVQRVYPELNLIPNLIVAPGWSDQKAVYEAMISASNKINGHWDAYVLADMPVESTDTIAKAIEWKNANGYTVERSKIFWPQGQDTTGTVYHLSTACAWQMLRTDATHNGIPMESPSNKETFVAKQYFGQTSKNIGFDITQANELNENGITTAIYWAARWVLWGPHGAKYQFGKVADKRVIFDNSLRMMMYMSNSFQEEHALTIDSPMTRAMADTIKHREQEKADALVAQGALIGKPVVSFEEAENSTADLVEGNFVWGFEGTPTPPFKSGTLQVAYSDAGFSSYFGEV